MTTLGSRLLVLRTRLRSALRELRGQPPLPAFEIVHEHVVAARIRPKPHASIDSINQHRICVRVRACRAGTWVNNGRRVPLVAGDELVLHINRYELAAITTRVAEDA